MPFQQRSSFEVSSGADKAAREPRARLARPRPAVTECRHRVREEDSLVRRFPTQHGRRPLLGAIIALLACLGSLIAVSTGSPAGETLPHPLLVLLMLIRG